MDGRTIPQILAHRGVSSEFDENTIEAFTAATERGADGVELDVRRTADGFLVVHHDPRLPDLRAIVASTASSLPESVPLLTDALAACGDLRINIEIKNIPGEPDFDPSCSVAGQVATLVRSMGLLDSVIVSSFNFVDITKVREADADVATGWLVLEVADPGVSLGHIVEGRHQALHPPARAVTAELVAAAHNLGVDVNTWTVDEPREMVALAGIGVDAIITNDPATARLTLDQWRDSPG